MQFTWASKADNLLARSDSLSSDSELLLSSDEFDESSEVSAPLEESEANTFFDLAKVNTHTP